MHQGVGEWLIERSELSFHKKIRGDSGGGGEGVIHAGRWHGDVHIHTFGSDTFDLNEVRFYCDSYSLRSKRDGFPVVSDFHPARYRARQKGFGQVW